MRNVRYTQTSKENTIQTLHSESRNRQYHAFFIHAIIVAILLQVLLSFWLIKSTNNVMLCTSTACWCYLVALVPIVVGVIATSCRFTHCCFSVPTGASSFCFVCSDKKYVDVVVAYAAVIEHCNHDDGHEPYYFFCSLSMTMNLFLSSIYCTGRN